MRYYLRTFGCRANQYDTERVRAMIEASGGTIVDAATEADVALFNSCAVTSAAEADLRRAVRRASREQPAIRSVVMGCASARDDGALRALPSVSALVAGAEPLALIEALELTPHSLGAVAASQHGARALLRIQDGCDEHCTFCATTLARGAHRSRSASELVREARMLAERHSEIVLTGIHIGSWGSEHGSSIGVLLEQLVRDVPRVRFRLSSVEATEVDERLAELLRAGDGRVAPHLHAPLQSGSNRVLRRMGRHWYTAERYAEAVVRLLDGRDVFGLGADVIAGFPGETEEDHAETLALVERLPFTSLHVFPFSLRPGVAAERLPGRVDGQTAARRARELRALADTKAAAYRARRIGGEADLVVVGELGRREGITEDYLTVPIAAPAPPRGERVRAMLLADTSSSAAIDESRLIARARSASFQA